MKQTIIVKGMTCAACAVHVEKAARRAAGVTDARVNLMDGTVTLEGEFDPERVRENIRAAGYEPVSRGRSGEGNARLREAAEERKNEERAMRARLIASVCFLIPLMYTAMGGMLGLPVPSVLTGAENAPVCALTQLLLLLPIVFLNRTYYQRGLKALLHLNPNMDSLVAVGSLAALGYGLFALYAILWGAGHGDAAMVEKYRMSLYFEGAGTILTLVTVGKTLESRAKKKTGEAVEKLRSLSPDTASVLREGRETEIPVASLRPGDIMVVRAGQRVPADGVLTEDACSFDESALTGESVPIDRQAGERVMAASLAVGGRALIRAERVGEDTTLSGIIRLVSDAASTKPPIARLADRIAGVFVPVVMGIALVTLCVWLLLGREIGFALEKAISVLVISCPCALGLATPVAVTVGIGRGAENGILYRSAAAIETAGRADTVVMDKTGTVTLGRPEVTDVLPVSVRKEELLRIAFALEHRSAHPLAKAVCELAGDSDAPAAEDFRELAGLGVEGTVGGERCLAGNERLMSERGVSLPEGRSVYTADGKTPLYVARGSRLAGVILLADAIREDSAAAVARLKELGCECVMLTGDRESAARPIAARAGIDRVISEVLPQEKEEKLRELQRQGKRVIMIGDGINDAPALTRADTGIAIGAGSDIAVDSADIVLMRSSLTDAVTAIALSEAVRRNIRQNLFWAFFYNLICIPLAAGVLEGVGISLSPMIASLAMSCSSVCVCLNALRLRSFGRRRREGTGSAVPTGSGAEKPLPAEESEGKKTRRVTLRVGGMMCSHCTATVEKLLRELGADEIAVSLEKGEAVFTAPAELDAETVKARIAGEDYEPGEWREEGN